MWKSGSSSSWYRPHTLLASCLLTSAERQRTREKPLKQANNNIDCLDGVLLQTVTVVTLLCFQPPGYHRNQTDSEASKMTIQENMTYVQVGLGDMTKLLYHDF